MPVQYLGIDTGSVAIAVALLDGTGNVLSSSYLFHHGNIRETLRKMLAACDLSQVEGIACTGGAESILKNAVSVDSRIAAVTAARHFHGKVGSLLMVGGERFGLIRFDEEGAYRNLRGNSTCAAGTGSFLDQQAGRLGLSGSDRLSEIALSNSGEPPRIASRCSVFAKTDLIHAQQEGYTLAEICDGLCLGLAKNIADTLEAGESLLEPVVFAGGVALNGAVTRHLESLLGTKIHTDACPHLYGAIGACLACLEDGSFRNIPGDDSSDSDNVGRRLSSPSDLVLPLPEERDYFHEPLTLKLSSYPDFTSREQFVFPGSDGSWSRTEQVETDIYIDLQPGSTHEAFLGIDIGSTSTKAVLCAPDASPRYGKQGGNGSGNEPGVLAGFYTRTAGQPIRAVQRIFETVDRIMKDKEVTFTILGTGTTGSGRKFIGKVIGADVILDEITAHAKAAVRLEPGVDTIIEIGGQDAKFTTLRNGIVTFSQMNTVCAAGTGSFIEEQAGKLGVPLSEYSKRAEGCRAPLVSDRCTVFMERDINHYLSRNYSVNEILAAALFSVRENYLLKVASRGAIGTKIYFQGATAKNRALVAAFEQKLKTPIIVSRYCHLTGALGSALVAEEETAGTSSFRGIGLYREEIPVRTEVCDLCTNHCRIRIADVQGESVAYGFLCGRDYDTKSFVNRNTSGFDMLREHRRTFSVPELEPITERTGDELRQPKEITIGIPAALHLTEELPLWKYFFKRLGIRTVTSEAYREALKDGKEVTGAEFCAPLTAFHGHALYCAEKADYVFLPISLESRMSARERKQGKKRYTCYYTQYASTLAASLHENGIRAKAVMPMLYRKNDPGLTRQELYNALRKIPELPVSQLEVNSAFDEAERWFDERKKQCRTVYPRTEEGKDGISVVLTGRPYTILSPSMNKGIPEMFAALGIRTYYQDMVPSGPDTSGDIEPLLSAFHWNYASKILETAAYCAKTENIYPVLITSFKCAPDSFAIEYFKRILDAKNKPYLILQLDEHDSGVGYETRIEAGVRAFRNHSMRTKDAAGPARETRALSINPGLEKNLAGKTIVFPNWDPITMPILTTIFRKEGIDARLLREDPISIQKSMRLNTGQCIPLSAVAEEYIDFIKTEKLDPEWTVLWMMNATVSCNIRLYPFYIKSLLEAHGDGMEKAGVYAGDISYFDFSPFISLNAYFAYLFGGTLRRLGCRIRPYEIVKGETDATIAEARELIIRAFSGGLSLEKAAEQVFAMFDAIPRRKEKRPKVAIFGDLYVRDNEVMNQDLIRTIEEAGGEVITTPYTEYMKIISNAYFKRMFRGREYVDWVKFRSLLATMELLEQKYSQYFRRIMEPSKKTGFSLSWRDIKLPWDRDFRLPWDRQEAPTLEDLLSRFNMRLEQDGESFDNMLKIFHILKEHPDVSLFVQTNPAFCCPSLITEAMSREIESATGVPIVTITYDGTGSPKNDLVVPYLKYPRKMVPLNK